jgi:site-specific DNA-methyltransferase (adenine-specific)
MISEVYNEDCMIGMKRYPDKYFDLAIVDPEYGISVTTMNMGGRRTIRPDKTKTWDNKPPSIQYFNELFRVSKNQIIWGGNYFDLPVHKCYIVWDKGESMYGRDFAECEQAWVSFDRPAKIYKINPNQLDRIHPTQKPVTLYKRTLRDFAKEGFKIIDTHLGSGSSRIAAYDMGFDFTGFELDPDYFNAQEKRFSNHIKQLNLFTNGSTKQNTTASLFEAREDL